MTLHLPKVTIFTLALATLTIAGDRPGLVAPPVRSERSHRIAAGAIRVPIPSIAQRDDYSCGAAALMAVCSYYGVGPRKIEAFKRKLQTDPENGTNFRKLIQYAESLGLEVRWKHAMTAEELDQHLRQARPVICAIQAYADDPATYDDPASNRNGHYVVAIGFDAAGYFFMDPSIGRKRGFLPRAEFLRRWHDNEGTLEHPEVFDHLGIAIFPSAAGTPFLQSARWID